MAEPRVFNSNDGNVNPFQQEALAGDTDLPTVLPDTAAPPAYNEAVLPPINSPPVHRRASSTTPSTTALEHTPLLNSQHRVYGQLNHEEQQKGVTRAFLLWLGIGQWYSGLCIFISFAFLAGGCVLVILSAVTLEALQQVKIITIAAGFLFILLSILWPCAWLWNLCNKTCGCSYVPLLGYAWVLSLLYAAVVGALFSGVTEHYEHKNCTFTTTDDGGSCAMSLWTLVGMVALMLFFIITNIFTCCCCSFRRESRYI